MINTATLNKILQEAHKDAGECQHNCRSFEVMFSTVEPGAWYVRYIRTDVTNPEKPKEGYRYLCFDNNGERTNCDPTFPSRLEENLWLGSLVSIKKIDYHYQLIEDAA